MYHYAGNNPVKYKDSNGEYIISKNKETGNYSLGTFRNGANNIHYATKALSNFIPFGGYSINLEKSISEIDPTSNSKILYNSDACSSVLNLSNEVDSMSFSKIGKTSKVLKGLGNIMALKGLKDVVEGYENDSIIDDFMAHQENDLFQGCQTDGDAVKLGIFLADGAIFYSKNETTMKEKGISKAEWGKRIRISTNEIFGAPKFESFNKLMEQ